jgi:hypothetical protein
MRLKIESPEATHVCYGSASRPADVERSARFLPVQLQRQAQSNWCWASIAASLGRYYGTRRVEQHDVASALLGEDCSAFSSDPALALRCNVCAMLDDALRWVGCFSHWSPGRPSFARIRVEIEAGRPLALSVNWHHGGSHFLLVTGYCRDTEELQVDDPLHGTTLQRYADFPQNYRTVGGVWRGTYWTCPPDLPILEGS